MSRVANEVAFGLENVGVTPGEIWPRVDEALASVGAGHLPERPVSELSAGELQRVCLASALALRPRLLLLDEPTSQLDPEAAEAFFDLVEQPAVRGARLRAAAGPSARARRSRPLHGARPHRARCAARRGARVARRAQAALPASFAASSSARCATCASPTATRWCSTECRSRCTGARSSR